MNKKSLPLLFFISAVGFVLHGEKQITPVRFSSKRVAEVLEWIDGVRYAVDAFAIRDINKVTFQIDAVQNGIQSAKSKKPIGKYIINKKRYTIAELADLEEKGKLPEKNRAVAKEALSQCCEDFGKIVGPFHETVQGLKHFLTELIEESCRIRGRMDSLLLDWAKCSNNEHIVFERNIQKEGEKNRGFIALNTFLTDLKIFFVDLKYNCPKACKQYEELKRTGNEKPHTRDGNT